MNLPPANLRVNIAIWAVLFGAVVVWQVVTARSRDLLSFGDVIRLARGSWILRWSLLASWIWLGWHLFVRTTVGD